jgi:hypothetical protein
MRQPLAREEQVEVLVGIRDGVVDRADVLPVRRGIARLLFQFALGARQRGFARVDLPGREFDEDLVVRIAVLAFEQHAAVVEQREDHDGAGVADEFALGDLAVGEFHAVARDFEEVAVVGEFAVDFGFFEVVVHGGSSTSLLDAPAPWTTVLSRGACAGIAGRNPERPARRTCRR